MAEEASGRPVTAGSPHVGIPPLGTWGLDGRNPKEQVGSGEWCLWVSERRLERQQVCEVSVTPSG